MTTSDIDWNTIPDLAGRLDLDDASLDWASRDYGDLVHHRPLAVLRPGSPDDIVSILAFAKNHALPVVPRAEGHSTAGQAQAPNGIVIDMTSHNQIHEVSRGRMVVDAGARWSQVVRAALPQGVTPPVLTDYLELSVGGTLSVGGVGGTSHHHGALTDNALELDVITPDGTFLTCSTEQHRDVFNAVRAGRGRNGVIVRATIRLVEAPTRTRKYRLRVHRPQCIPRRSAPSRP